MIVIGRKRLPDVRKREKEWAFVYKVSRRSGEIEIFRDLHLAKSEFKMDPLIKGKWA